VPESSDKPYDMKELVRQRRGRRRLLRSARAFRHQYHRRLRAPETGVRSASSANQPGACSPACSTSTRRSRPRASSASATRFNIPLVTFEDVPGFLPGTRPGVGRHHPPRRQAPLRLLRSDRAQADRGGAQGLRRRVRRHVEQSTSGATSTSAGRAPRWRSWAPRARFNILYREELAKAADPVAERRRPGRRVQRQVRLRLGPPPSSATSTT